MLIGNDQHVPFGDRMGIGNDIAMGELREDFRFFFLVGDFAKYAIRHWNLLR